MLCVQVLVMRYLNKLLLETLLELAQNDTPASVSVLAQVTGHSRREVADGLNELDQLGLVRAERVRLTFLGLAKATGLAARRGRQAA